MLVLVSMILTCSRPSILPIRRIQLLACNLNRISTGAARDTVLDRFTSGLRDLMVRRVFRTTVLFIRLWLKHLEAAMVHGWPV